MEWNDLRIPRRGQYNEHLDKFGSVVQETSLLSVYSIFSSGGHFVQWSGTICGRDYYHNYGEH